MTHKTWWKITEGALVGKIKSYGVNELETLTLAQGGSHSRLVSLLIKADWNDFCFFWVCVDVCVSHTKQPHILLTPADRLQRDSSCRAKPVESLEPWRGGAKLIFNYYKAARLLVLGELQLILK